MWPCATNAGSGKLRNRKRHKAPESDCHPEEQSDEGSRMESCSLRFTGSFACAQDDRCFYTFAVILRSEATKDPVLIHFLRLLLPLTTPQSLSATAPLTRGAFFSGRLSLRRKGRSYNITGSLAKNRRGGSFLPGKAISSGLRASFPLHLPSGFQASPWRGRWHLRSK